MERRRAVIAAATASLTLLAGAAAVSINSGIVGASGNDDVGQIQQVDATTPDSVTVDAPDGSAGRERARDSSAPATTSSPRADDRDHDDEEHLDDDRSGATGDHAYEVEHEYEGADDDD
jgi:hypothetical protein